MPHLGPRSRINLNEEGVEGVSGAEVADGVEECRKAVRRQVGAGTDWIKVRVPFVKRCVDDVFELKISMV